MEKLRVGVLVEFNYEDLEVCVPCDVFSSLQ